MSFEKNIVPRFIWPDLRFIPRRLRHNQVDSILGRLRQTADVGLHLGAGSSKLPGMLNCDKFDPRADRPIDAIDLSEFSDETVDLIEHHHMIEHLSLAEVEIGIVEWRRVLRPGGHLVFSCPDITRICARYLKHRFLDIFWPRPDTIAYNIKTIVGSQEHLGMFHRSHFDKAILRRWLPANGFRVLLFSAWPLRPTPSLLVVCERMSCKAGG